MNREEYLQTATKPTPIKYCQYCGKKLERKRFKRKWEDLGVFSKRKYCDMECMRKAFIADNKTNQKYSPAHHTARMQVYLKEGRKRICEICGSTKNIDVHHIDKNYNNNSSDNLMIVCRSCHMKIHRQRM